MKRVEIVVIGGGIAGVSAAALFARHAPTVLLERESALGYHSSGRSATFYHFGIGDDVVRGLTAASRFFFADPPPGYSDVPLWQEKAALFIATPQHMDELVALETEMRRFTDSIARVGPDEMQAIVPVLKVGGEGAVAGVLDTGGRKLDADLLLQANARALRAAGSEIRFNAGVTGIAHDGTEWIVDTAEGSYAAKTVVNAAGAWADELAVLAGVRPLGLTPLRRTIIGFDPPEGIPIADWPFLKTVQDDGFYMLPDAGRLLVSPMDVTPSPPCDVQPEDYEMALAAWRIEEATTLSVGRIALKWAGLRSFVADKVPTAGFAPDAPGFFWLAGQGGYGLQTSPAMAMAAEALLFGLPWPGLLSEHGVEPHHIRPDRLFA
ncbi:NAD(P)/FAD-dependent oxidoreductase [Sphingopyxis granuli]|uniref:FAD-dependent oxidoreductase n=1 Tax=Sphingopyxis granuli TaxID=267128 RepID=A0AA86L520_9SPHN|nr:FAD-binding oxidoreductase [Sphingopyxis granuli]AMG76013.1 FAD-dependent oxidoreductase [Sphingopyxis granuli]